MPYTVSLVQGHMLLLYRYNSSIGATDRSRLLLLWSVAAIDTVTSDAHRYCGL
jgi:hypothetical protein